MARLANALRLALGGATGALEGYGAKQERLKKEEETRRQVERQALMDALTTAQALKGLDFETMAPTGRMPQPGMAEPSGATIEPIRPPAPSAMLGRAIQAGMGVREGVPSLAAPRAGTVLPSLETMPKRPAGRPATSGPAPEAEVAIPGFGAIGFRRVSEEERQQRKIRGLEQEERLKSTIATEEKNQRIQNLVEAGYTRADAIKRVELDAKYADVEMTPSVATARRGQDIDLQIARERLAAERLAAGRRGQSQDTGGVVLPSITEAINNFKSITPDQLRKISSYGVAAASTGQQQGGFAELGLTGTGSMLGIIGDAEKRYAQQAGAIADAVARASEVGVLTNFDINRFRSQIIFSPGDSERIKQEKLARAVAWGEWMASNKNAVESGQFDRITATPESIARYQIAPRKLGESVEAYLARTGGR